MKLENPLDKSKFKLKETKEEYKKDTQDSIKLNTKQVAVFVSHLFGCTTVLKIMHLQTGSYAKHKALNAAYDIVSDFQDRITEVYQGYYDCIVDGYESYPVNEYYKMNPIDYLKYLLNYLETSKELFKENDAIINIIDEFIGEISQQKYMISKLS